MELSDLSSAKKLKFKLRCQRSSANFHPGALLTLKSAKGEQEFWASQYGAPSTEEERHMLCETDPVSAEYIRNMLESDQLGYLRTIFVIEQFEDGALAVQTYAFRSITEYRSDIFIHVRQDLLDQQNMTLEQLYRRYVWDQIGSPVLFCWSYKSRKKDATAIRLISGRYCLRLQHSHLGLEAVGQYRWKELEENKDSLDSLIDICTAPKIQFIPALASAPDNEELAADMEKTSASDSYLARWDAYSEMDKKLREMEEKEFGELKCTCQKTIPTYSKVSYVFQLEESMDERFLGKEVGFLTELAMKDSGAGLESGGKKNQVKPIPVGEIREISGTTVTTVWTVTDDLGRDWNLSDGYLVLNSIGNRVIANRRGVARNRIAQHEAPIKYLDSLIEDGAQQGVKRGNEKPVSNKFKRTFDKAELLNEGQKKALEVAINSPDIALIQGPPGTGKTTVIKAICARFQEIYEQKEKELKEVNPEHTLRQPKILISSFQNDAVDNAISKPQAGEIPAYRKTAKRAKASIEEQHQKRLDSWHSHVRRSVRQMIEAQIPARFVEEKERLWDEYLSYKNSGESLDKAGALIKHYLSFTAIQYPEQLVDRACFVIRQWEQTDSEADIPNPIVSRLEALRTEPVSFADDGRSNAYRFCRYLRMHRELDLESGTIENIEAVCEENCSEETFERYVQTVKQMKKRFCTPAPAIDIRDTKAVNRCLLEMWDCFTKQYAKTLTDPESKKSLILSEFLSRLDEEYEAIARNYTVTTAATCQTCIDTRGRQQEYDLVIVDEAARAHPLDLFIPMSMGKKIILVGDQKQLPHMLEPDIVEAIGKNPDFKDLPELEKSLFERLFELFSRGTRPQAVMLDFQFRMHPDICSFVSEVFYDNLLKTDPSLTPDKRASPPEINGGRALTFVNIPYSRGGETGGLSKSRQAEINVLCEDVRKILESDPDPEYGVGVITFYSAQAKLIRDKLEMVLDNEQLSKVEVNTVDAFQGKEFDYTLLSCVRSNRPKQEGEAPHVGFLKKPNRLCVAFSRARRQLIVYGDGGTLCQIPCFARLYEICKTEGGGCYREQN